MHANWPGLAPALREEPGARTTDRKARVIPGLVEAWRVIELGPAIEARTAGVVVDIPEHRLHALVSSVSTEIVEHVRDRVAGLRRRGDEARVVSVVEDLPGALGTRGARDGPIQPLCGRALERTDAAGERHLIVRLDDQVEMIVLDAEVNDAEVAPLDRRIDGLADRVIGSRLSQRDRRDHAQRDMHWSRAREAPPYPMAFARPGSFRRPSCTLALPSPRPELEAPLLEHSALLPLIVSMAIQ